MGDTIADLGELGLIEKIASRLATAKQSILGPGDDAAIVDVGVSGQAVVSVDVLVEGFDFRCNWSTAVDVGHHAVAASVADIEAMGASPVAILVALAIPGETEVSWALDLTDGIVAEARIAGVEVAGGDISEGREMVIAMTALGDLAGRQAVTRAGAGVGDQVAVAGRLGWAAAGLAMLSRGFRSPRVLADAHRRPAPPYGLGRAAACAGATAMIDISDGLVCDLGHVARASGVSVDLRSDALPIEDVLAQVAGAFGVDPLTWVLAGGDDHALVATFPPLAPLPDGFRVIGEVAAGFADIRCDGAVLNVLGHEHFRQ